MTPWMADYLWGLATPIILAVVAIVCGLVCHLLMGNEMAVIERHGEPDK